MQNKTTKMSVETFVLKVMMVIMKMVIMMMVIMKMVMMMMMMMMMKMVKRTKMKRMPNGNAQKQVQMMKTTKWNAHKQGMNCCTPEEIPLA
jgi:hypothetical protein